MRFWPIYLYLSIGAAVAAMLIDISAPKDRTVYVLVFGLIALTWPFWMTAIIVSNLLRGVK